MRRFPEAEREIKIAQDLDPLSVIISLGVGEIQEWQRNYDAAYRQFQKTMELDPNFCGTYGHLATIYEHKGLLRDAMEQLKKIEVLKGHDSEAVEIDLAYKKAAYPGVTQFDARRDLDMKAQGKYVPALVIAEDYLRLGKKAEAYHWLEMAYEERDSGLAFLQVEAGFDSLRNDPQFQQLIKKIGLS
ncbi:MAG TPA: hypothetical protein VH088_20490 [Terriglobales bacterium]|jgi:tetratricopeptide (TPR) repeat protein|nr:hypothetical protein [Terriglobales bacterium]